MTRLRPGTDRKRYLIVQYRQLAGRYVRGQLGSTHKQWFRWTSIEMPRASRLDRPRIFRTPCIVQQPMSTEVSGDQTASSKQTLPWILPSDAPGPLLSWKTATVARSCAPSHRDRTASQMMSRSRRTLHIRRDPCPSGCSCCRCPYTPLGC